MKRGRERKRRKIKKERERIAKGKDGMKRYIIISFFKELKNEKLRRIRH